MTHHPIIRPLAAKALATTTFITAFITAFSAAPAHAGLVARSLDGDASTAEAYYDTALGITWMRDRNHLAGVTPGMVSTGFINWADGDAAIAALNASSTGGYGLSGWRMPTASGVATIGGAGCQFGFNGSTDCGSNVHTSSSELAHMFHNNLGNQSSRDGSGNFRPGSLGVDFGLVNHEDFLSLSPGRYWSSTDSYRLIFSTPINGKVTFDFNDGSQSVTAPTSTARGYVWLVHDGDVGTAVSTAVPEPASLALVGLGLLALGATGRRTATSAS